jgi:Icc-related predicted phosphoesterase
MNNVNEEKLLRVLLVSDVHNSSYMFDNVKAFAKENKVKYDYVFYLGDFDSLNIDEQYNETIIAESIEAIHHMLILLETISKNVYYIGGNHDPLVLFKDNAPQLGKHAINVHKKYIPLKEDNNLIIAGIGGSVITVGSPTETKVAEYKIQNYDMKVYEGFPYMASTYKESDALYGNTINELLTLLEPELNSINSNKQLILLSHCGPFNSSTSNVTKRNTSLYTGSLKLQEFICKHSNSILLNAHGHSHLAYGCQLINNTTTIINPGSLRKGRFAELTLSKVVDAHKWSIKSINLIKLYKEH